MQNQKRVLAIHDISCVGKCSLTVALPIISAAGIECSILPTAILSTHTGGFEGYTFRDLTDDMTPITDHWKTLSNFKIDAIYSGYLGSERQLELVSGIQDKFQNGNTLIAVDPVMADNGVMYSGFSDSFASGMARLCSRADLIMPNITEAAFMLGETYKEGPYDKAYIEKIVRGLRSLGAKNIVLTGVYFDASHLGAASLEAGSNQVEYSMSDKIDGYFHGTGDVFGSVLLSSVMNGFTLSQSAQIAAEFTAQSIMKTKQAQTEPRYGVNFEECLFEFSAVIHNQKNLCVNSCR